MSSLRKVISRRMVENWNAIPHVTQFDEADITSLLELRKKYVAAYEQKGARLTADILHFKGDRGHVEETSHLQLQPR